MAYRRDVFAYWESRLKPANAIDVSFLLGQPLLKGRAQMSTRQGAITGLTLRCRVQDCMLEAPICRGRLWLMPLRVVLSLGSARSLLPAAIGAAIMDKYSHLWQLNLWTICAGPNA
jgi:hypothetical protein